MLCRARDGHCSAQVRVQDRMLQPRVHCATKKQEGPGQGPFKLASQSNGLDCDHRALIPLLSSPRQKRPRESGGDGMWKTRGEDRISQAG